MILGVAFKSLYILSPKIIDTRPQTGSSVRRGPIFPGSPHGRNRALIRKAECLAAEA